MRKKRTYSIDHFLKMFSFFVLMIAVFVVIAIGIVSKHKMQEQVAETNKTALTIMVNEIDRELEGADQQLYDVFYSSDVFSQLSGDSNVEETYRAEREIISSLNKIVVQHEIVNGCWLYLPENNDHIRNTRSADDKDGIEYFQVSLESQTGEYWVSYLSQEQSVQLDMDVFKVALIAITAVFLLMISVYILQRVIYRPLIKLKNVMIDVQHGNLSPAVERSRILEFQLLNQTFEYMMKEIKNLRFDVYEQQLTQQKIKRQYLQIQLKSHFYLNCLNIIHSLAQVKNYSLIQELTRSLGAYFRYTYEDSSELHVLENELEHVRNYMHIQEIRFPDRFVYYEEATTSLLGVRIPSLVLQTFIENSIEHAIDLDKDNWVRLTITPEEIEQTQGMNIVIKDNGKGFALKQLEQFNNKDGNSLVLEAKNEIGIKNVINRLELIYKGKAQIRFSNDKNGGAVVDIWLPVDQE